MKRYAVTIDNYDGVWHSGVDESPAGPWVKYEDVQEGLANYAQELTELNAHCADLSRQHHEALDELEQLKRTREQERDYADMCYALQRATEKLQELAEECADCDGKGIVGVCQAECGACHAIRLVLAICSPTPQT